MLKIAPIGGIEQCRRRVSTVTSETLPSLYSSLQGERLVSLPPQLLRSHRARVSAVAHGDHLRTLWHLQSLHGSLIAGVQGVVGVEVHAAGYRPLCVILRLADVHDRDPLASLQHVPQGPHVDVPLRHHPASVLALYECPKCLLGGTALAVDRVVSSWPRATLTAGSTPSPAAPPPAPSGRSGPCSAATPRTRQPRPPKRTRPSWPWRCRPGRSEERRVGKECRS